MQMHFMPCKDTRMYCIFFTLKFEAGMMLWNLNKYAKTPVVKTRRLDPQE